MKILLSVIFLLTMNQIVVADMDLDLSKVSQSFLEEKNCNSKEQLKITNYLESGNYKKILEIGKELVDTKYFDDYLLYYLALSEYKLGNYNQSIKYLDMVLSAQPQCHLTHLFGGLKENKNKLREYIIYFNLSENFEKMNLKSISHSYSFYAKKNIINHLSYQYGYTERNIDIMERILDTFSFGVPSD